MSGWTARGRHRLTRKQRRCDHAHEQLQVVEDRLCGVCPECGLHRVMPPVWLTRVDLGPSELVYDQTEFLGGRRKPVAS